MTLVVEQVISFFVRHLYRSKKKMLTVFVTLSDKRSNGIAKIMNCVGLHLVRLSVGKIVCRTGKTKSLCY